VTRGRRQPYTSTVNDEYLGLSRQRVGDVFPSLRRVMRKVDPLARMRALFPAGDTVDWAARPLRAGSSMTLSLAGGAKLPTADEVTAAVSAAGFDVHHPGTGQYDFFLERQADGLAVGVAFPREVDVEEHDRFGRPRKPSGRRVLGWELGHPSHELAVQDVIDVTKLIGRAMPNAVGARAGVYLALAGRTQLATLCGGVFEGKLPPGFTMLRESSSYFGRDARELLFGDVDVVVSHYYRSSVDIQMDGESITPASVAGVLSELLTG
jgi:hypothetical protein